MPLVPEETDAGGVPSPEPGPTHEPEAVRDALGAARDLVRGGVEGVKRAPHALEPAWRRVTDPEPRLPATAAVLVAIVLQLLLPRRFAFHPAWLLAAVEGLLLAGLVAVNPLRIDRRSNAIRVASVGLIAVATLGNAWSAGHLIRALINGHAGTDAGLILRDGGAIWLTNVLVFALWYWELDRGGPAARAHFVRPYPDFQFPQMENPTLAPPDWEPRFWDYLYVSFTNAIAFSPTDAMPLARWAKLTMLAQSLVSVSVVALVIARAVNILR